ncbi:hypothetical protein KKI93_10995 [Xenorhabdus bovienii]|uniref:hypothetical protein n=1 Tax=Xenorhabdus bovienii TaxID=40576 RepID=UPI0023B20AC7|nr:hypothetical protein [Xenorhabdus bovienii]MDE9550144.1 hypothetical protein [Xenorhabdus bovienii]MDE9564575.1 hypothetical protein [Xenorhabdus bovienii]
MASPLRTLDISVQVKYSDSRQAAKAEDCEFYGFFKDDVSDALPATQKAARRSVSAIPPNNVTKLGALVAISGPMLAPMNRMNPFRAMPAPRLDAAIEPN